MVPRGGPVPRRLRSERPHRAPRAPACPFPNISSTETTPSAPRAPAALRRAATLLLGSWVPRILLLVGALWLLSRAGALPVAWSGTAGLVALVTTAAILVWYARDILNWLLYPVKRKLWVSYIFGGFLPLLLLSAFFLLAFYVILGLFGYYALQANLQARGATLGKVADRILIGLPTDADDDAILDSLERTATRASELAPGATAWYLEHDDRRVTRLLGSGGAATPLGAIREVPEWAVLPWEGVVRTADGEWFGAVSPGPTGTAVVLAPLVPVLMQSASETSVSIRTILTLYVGEESVGLATPPTSANRFEIPFDGALVALEAAGAEPELSGGTVLISFAFAPIELLWGVTGGLPESLDDFDISASLLLALGGLGFVFVLFQLLAVYIGIRIVRSITRSVEALSGGTRMVRSGNFGHEVTAPSRDQLGELARSFNIMTAKIQDDMDRLRRAAQIEQEMDTARESQARLLPRDGAVTVPGFRVAAICRPAAAVGGDYYDLIPLAANRLGVVIADVSGTGARAAFTMAELKGLMLALSRAHASPRQVLIEANRALYETLDRRTFITITYAVFDSEAGTVTWARAGHSPLLRLGRHDGMTPRSDVYAPHGLGVALDPGPVFERVLEERTAPLVSSDTWVFFTDGVSEAMNGRSEMFGEERLARLLEDCWAQPPEEMRQTVEDAVLEFTGAKTHADDLTMVLVRVL